MPIVFLHKIAFLLNFKYRISTLADEVKYDVIDRLIIKFRLN